MVEDERWWDLEVEEMAAEEEAGGEREVCVRVSRVRGGVGRLNE